MSESSRMQLVNQWIATVGNMPSVNAVYYDAPDHEISTIPTEKLPAVVLYDMEEDFEVDGNDALGALMLNTLTIGAAVVFLHDPNSSTSARRTANGLFAEMVQTIWNDETLRGNGDYVAFETLPASFVPAPIDADRANLWCAFTEWRSKYHMHLSNPYTVREGGE